MPYSEDEMLLLSGIQHYLFCPRQWALIHVEQQWDENKHTIEGELLHKNVDNPFYRQKNGNTITLRSVPIVSKELGLYGLTDAVELIQSTSDVDSVTLKEHHGNWQLLPIEYKKGSTKQDERDIVQVVAQSICLEEMYNTHINKAALFYWEEKHRQYIDVNDDLRTLTIKCAKEMHTIFKTGKTPPPILKKNCKSCSLYDICMPEIDHCSNVINYLKTNLYEKTT